MSISPFKHPTALFPSTPHLSGLYSLGRLHWATTDTQDPLEIPALGNAQAGDWGGGGGKRKERRKSLHCRLSHTKLFTYPS